MAASTAALVVAASGATGATSSVAVFSRFAYADGTSPSDAAKFQFLTLGPGNSTTTQATNKKLFASIHAADPSTRLLLYKTIYTNPKDPTGLQNCVTWNASKPFGGIPPSEFVLGSNGQPLYNSTYGTYWLDPGNAAVQSACESNAISMAKSFGYNGIYWDMDSTSLFWAGLSSSNCGSNSCRSDANWQAAMESFIKNTSAALHANGLLSIGNISGGAIAPAGNGGPTFWDAYQKAGLDGAMEESFTSGTNHLPVGIAQWKQEVANDAWNEANGKYMIGNADVTSNQALNTYGLATMLLTAGGRSSWAVDSGNANTGEYWFPSYTAAQALGAPLGAYTIQSNGLYVRHFQNGAVVVNPTLSSIKDPVFGTLGAQSGLIQ